MTTDAIVERKPRRKWGWFFLAAFFLQALVFGGMIGTLLTDAGRDMSDARYSAKRGSVEETGSYASYAQQKRSEARVLIVLLVIGSVATLTLAFVGLRRRKS